MPARLLHFVRHGEVHNPERLVYGRLPNFGLSDRGHEMARAAAESFALEGAEISSLTVSPLQRTQESSLPWQELFGLTPKIEERVIEPWNKFEGYPLGARSLAKKPSLALQLYNPSLPSWGEPYEQIVQRMRAVAEELWHATPSGDAVVVSHQLPIWMLYSSARGLSLPHNPRNRRCQLSSITSFEMKDGLLVPVNYRVPYLPEEA